MAYGAVVKNKSQDMKQTGTDRRVLTSRTTTTTSRATTGKTKGPIGPADSAMRSKENVVVRSKFGASTSDFKCRYDLLEEFEGMDGIPQLKSTTKREEMERQCAIKIILAKAWKFKAAAARLRLARLNANDRETRRRLAAQIEVARCDLKVKNIESKISILKRDEAKRLADGWKKVETKDKSIVSDLKETIQAKRDYAKNVPIEMRHASSRLKAIDDGSKKKKEAKKRDVFYFSYCKQEGHAPWYCMALDKREKWFEYPCAKWFITSKGKQLYCPEGNVMMDFSDQHVYSRATSDIKGNECITDKGLLAELNLKFTPKTYHVKNCEWVGEVPPRLPPGVTDEQEGVWFVKDTLRNYSTGIFMARTREECIKITEKENSYVVQPQIIPYLIDERKSHIRTYYLMYSPAGSNDVRFFMFRDGYLALALKKYRFDDLDRDVQVTRDRTCRMSDKMDIYADFLPQIVSTLCDLSATIKPKLRPDTDKSNFMIVGLDLMVDHQKFVWMLEANAGPVVRGADYPHIKAMIDLVIPEGSGIDAEKDIVNKLWFELIPRRSDEESTRQFATDLSAKIVQSLKDHKAEKALHADANNEETKSSKTDEDDDPLAVMRSMPSSSSSSSSSRANTTTTGHSSEAASQKESNQRREENRVRS